MLSKITNNLVSLILLVVLLGLWEWLAIDPRMHFLFGAPSAVMHVLWENTLDVSLPYHMLITGAEALLGFLLGVFLGTLSGFLLWYSPAVACIARPYLLILGAVPVFAFAPMMIVWFGIGFSMKVAVAALGTFLLALMQAFEGSQKVGDAEYNLFRLWGANRFQILQKLVFPSALSWVFNSMKLNVGVALTGAFIGEFISANRGIGYYMIHAGSLYDIPAVFAGAIYLVLLALIFHMLVAVIERQKFGIIKFLTIRM